MRFVQVRQIFTPDNSAEWLNTFDEYLHELKGISMAEFRKTLDNCCTDFEQEEEMVECIKNASEEELQDYHDYLMEVLQQG